MPATDTNFRDNAASGRFELVEDGGTAFATYSLRGSTLVIPHVEAPPVLRGKGTAGRLMEALVRHARERNLKVVPLCSYANLWFRRHPVYSDVLE